jgi:conjugal transfer mating pair stabilization protein TraN
MGEECVAPQREQSMDFEKAVAAIQAIQYMRLDGSCDITGCTAFTGTPMECKKAVGGVVNCCEKPDNVSLGDYIQLIVMTDRVAMAESMSGTVLQGAWETLRTPIVNSPSATWQAIRGDFASAWDTLTGVGEAAIGEEAKTGLISNAMQNLTNKVAEWTGEVFGDAAKNLLFEPAASGAAGDYALSSSVGAAMSFLMTAYTVYLVAMILVQVIWACEESEFELGAKRQLKSCTFTGSYCKKRVLGACIEKRETYCCFNSPLSRIIQEQAQPQLGYSMKDSACMGMTFDMIAELDWDQIDLSEWIGILVQTGNMPGDQIDIDTLTGEASLIGTEGRLNVRERSEQRLDGLDSTSLRHNAEEHLRGSVP